MWPPNSLTALDGRFHVADVVQRIENAEDIDAVFDRQTHELAHHIIGVVAVSHQVLAAQQHLQARVLDPLPDGLEALPGVFVEETYAAVEGSAAPDLEREEAHLVQLAQDIQHVAGAHAGGD